MKNAIVKYLKEDEYEKWDNFVEISPQGNIFNKSYWLNCVCREYKILVCEENGNIIGGIVLPVAINNVYRNPKLTPQLGILLEPAAQRSKYSTVLSRETEIMCTLLDNFPHFKQFDMNMSYKLTNLLPFIWKDYKTSVRYTYIIDDLTDVNSVFSNFQYDVKYLIKKAVKNGIKVTTNHTINEFYEVNEKTFSRQGMQMPYSIEFLEALDKVMEQNGSRKMFFAETEDGKIVGATYILYNKRCAYYLMGGADAEFRNLGVQALLLSESIKFAAEVSEKFDFEGSMVKNIERSFRQFSGKQQLVFNVYKSDKAYELMYSFARKNKNLIRKFIKV